MARPGAGRPRKTRSAPIARLERRRRLLSFDTRALLSLWSRALQRHGATPGAFLNLVRLTIRTGQNQVRSLHRLRRSYKLVLISLVLVHLVPTVALFMLAPVGLGVLVSGISWTWFFSVSYLVHSQLWLVKAPRQRSVFKAFPLACTLTLLRLLSIPLLVMWIPLGHGGQALGIWRLVIFTVIIATDMLDGFVARVTDTRSEWGRIFDHASDVLLGAGLVIALWWSSLIPSWFLVLGLLRFLLPMLGGGWLYIRHLAWRIEPSILGKATVLALAACGWLLLFSEIVPQNADSVGYLSDLMIDLSALLVCLNLVYIFRKGYTLLQTGDLVD